MEKINKYIVVKTGLHIGGESEYEIGAIDSVVVKDPNEYPYIPGSSLKGKIRSLLETIYGERLGAKIEKVDKNSKKKKYVACDCGECPICKTFGSSNKEKTLTSRVIFRDAYIPGKIKDEVKEKIEEIIGFTPLTKEELEPNEFIEVKYENVIDRMRGNSNNLRSAERVKPGTIFESEIIIRDVIGDEYKLSDEQKEKINEICKEQNVSIRGERDEDYIIALLEIGFKLLENDYLGGNGTRGYGSVMIINKEG